MNLFPTQKYKDLLDLSMSKFLENSKNIGILGIIQIGENQVSDKYISLKQSLCFKLGIDCHIFRISSALADVEIISECKKIMGDTKITGLIIQMPLPRQSLYSLIDLIPEEKDIDALNKKTNKFISPVIRAFSLFHSCCDRIKSATVIGDGALVGLPVTNFLKDNNVVVNTVNNYSSGTFIHTDLVVCAAGIPSLIKGDMLSENTCVVDFGSSVVNGKTVGDFDLTSKTAHLGLVATSPGGMGPLVVRFLVMNFLGI